MGQSSVEYIMIYAVAVLVIAIVLAALYELGVFNPSQFLGSSCVFPAGINCATARLGGQGTLVINLKQFFSSPISVTEIGCNSNGTFTRMQQLVPPVSLNIGSNASFTTICYTTGNVIFNGSAGKLYKGYFILNYTIPGSSTQHTIKGEVIERAVNSSGVIYYPNVASAGANATVFYGNRITMTLPSGYSTYIYGCGDGAYALNGQSWTQVIEGKSKGCASVSGGNPKCVSLGYSTTSDVGTCTSTGSWNMSLVGLGISAPISDATIYYASNATDGISTLTYNAPDTFSYVVIVASSGWVPGILSLPSGCTLQQYAYLPGQTDSEIAICIQGEGNYIVTMTNTSVEPGSAITAYVIPGNMVS
jgi:hypothetical protein